MAGSADPVGSAWSSPFMQSVRLEAAVNAPLAHAEDNPSSALTMLHQLKGDVNNQVVTPTAQALHMAGGV